ncbi:MAG TPA: MFS transporter [Ilumatobacteraceae bacterium]|nr:MFS transporter [Ilumatobacteraceae bacterium]
MSPATDSLTGDADSTPAHADSAPAQARALVWTFGLLTASLAAGYGVMFAMLDDFRDAYGISEASLGTVVAVGFFSSFVAQVLFAPQADRGHARLLVFLGVAFNLVGLIVMAYGSNLWLLLAGRVAMGVGTGMTLPAARRIVILADPDNLGHNIGRLLVADVFGFAIGPALSAVLVDPFGIAAPFLVIAVLTMVCVPVVARAHVDETTGDDQPTARFAFDLLRIRPLAGAICFGMAAFLMIGTFDALWALVMDDLDTADWIANLGITLFSLPLIFLGSFGGRLAQRVGPFRLATRCSWCSTARCRPEWRTSWCRSSTPSTTRSRSRPLASRWAWWPPRNGWPARRACSVVPRPWSAVSRRSWPACSTSTRGAPSPTVPRRH